MTPSAPNAIADPGTRQQQVADGRRSATVPITGRCESDCATGTALSQGVYLRLLEREDAALAQPNDVQVCRAGRC